MYFVFFQRIYLFCRTDAASPSVLAILHDLSFVSSTSLANLDDSEMHALFFTCRTEGGAERAQEVRIIFVVSWQKDGFLHLREAFRCFT